MRPHVVWTIFQKEIVESLRDRVTLLVLLGLPFLIYPLSIWLIAQVVQHQVAAEAQRVSTVAVWGVEATSLFNWFDPTNKLIRLERWLGIPTALRIEIESGRLQPTSRTNTPSMRIDMPIGLSKELPASSANTDDPVILAAREVLYSKKADVVLILWPGFDEALKQQGRGRVTVYFDSVAPGSSQASSRLSGELELFRKQLVRERQVVRGLPPGFSTALDVGSDDVAPVRRQLSDILGRFLPLLLIMLSVVGAMVAAVDLTAGEKDRATMQTLLCAPVRSFEIVAGKFLTIWSLSLFSALANVIGLGLTIHRLLAALHVAVSLPGTFFAVFGLLLPTTWTIAALFLAVGVLARDVKDAGNFLAGTSIITLLPVGMTLLPGVELNPWTCFVPLVNLALVMRALLVGSGALSLMLLALLISFIYAGFALALAARVFGREEVLLGGSFSWRWLLRGDAKRPAVPTPALVITLFAIVMVGVLYVGLTFLGRGWIVLVPATEYGLLLLPAVVLAASRKFPLRETFSLRWPHWRSLLGSALIGLTAGAGIAGVAMRLAPPPDSVLRELREVLMLGEHHRPLWVLWLVVGLTPAMCEETLFRGLILSGLRRWGSWAAIGISSLLFGLAHGAIYQLLPTFALGLVLGYTVWRTGSLYCSILIHTLNNCLIATLVWRSGQGTPSEALSVPWIWTLVAMGLTAAGLAMLKGPKEKPS